MNKTPLLLTLAIFVIAVLASLASMGAENGGSFLDFNSTQNDKGKAIIVEGGTDLQLEITDWYDNTTASKIILNNGEIIALDAGNVIIIGKIDEETK